MGNHSSTLWDRPSALKAAAALLLTWPALALAQEFPGTKTSPTSSSFSGGPAGFGPLFNVLIALGIVYALLRFAMPKLMSKMSKRLVTGAGSSIKIEETANFAGGSLYVVSARGKTLLLAVGSQGVQNLADLTETASIAEPMTFGEMVERELKSGSAAVFADRPIQPDQTDQTDPSDTAAPTPDADWAIALERLERLAN